MGNREGFAAIGVQAKKKFDGKKAEAYNLCQKFKIVAEQELKAKQGTAQGKGFYWTNRTSLAVQGIRCYAVLGVCRALPGSMKKNAKKHSFFAFSTLQTP